jgi:hypothetical protein
MLENLCSLEPRCRIGGEQLFLPDGLDRFMDAVRRFVQKLLLLSKRAELEFLPKELDRPSSIDPYHLVPIRHDRIAFSLVLQPFCSNSQGVHIPSRRVLTPSNKVGIEIHVERRRPLIKRFFRMPKFWVLSRPED